MYTHVYVSLNDARRLFRAFAEKPLLDEPGALDKHAFRDHFNKYNLAYLCWNNCKLEKADSPELYAIKFNHQLVTLPSWLSDMNVHPEKVEILGVHSQSNKLLAGRYSTLDGRYVARIENAIHPNWTAYEDQPDVDPFSTQIIWARGPSLIATKLFIRGLNSGNFQKYLVEVFE